MMWTIMRVHLWKYKPSSYLRWLVYPLSLCLCCLYLALWWTLGCRSVWELLYKVQYKLINQMSRILVKDTFRTSLGSNLLNSAHRTVSNPVTFTHFWLSGTQTAHSPQHRLCLEVPSHHDLLYCPADVQQASWDWEEVQLFDFIQQTDFKQILCKCKGQVCFFKRTVHPKSENSVIIFPPQSDIKSGEVS